MDVSFGNMKVRMNAFRASHQPPDQDDCFAVDVVDALVTVDTPQPEAKLPVLITPDLSDDQEDQILDVLIGHMSALGWSIVELQDITPSICIPRVPYIDDFTHSRRMQQFLVPNLEEVDMKEVLSHIFLQFWFEFRRFSLFLFIVFAANIPQVLLSELGGVLPVFLLSTFC